MRLLFSAFWPWTVIFLSALIVWFQASLPLLREGRHGCAAIIRTCCIHAMLRALPIALYLLYFVLASTSYRILGTFQCDEFAFADEKQVFRRYLHDDYAYDCDRSGEYQRAKTWSYGLIVLYPIGVPTLFLILLAKSAKAIRHHKPSALMRATRFVSVAPPSNALAHCVVPTRHVSLPSLDTGFCVAAVG